MTTDHTTTAPQTPQNPQNPQIPQAPTALAAPTLCAAFQATVSERGGQPALAIHDSDQVWTWEQYGQAVERYARGLAALGVGRADAVCLMLTNRPEFALWDVAAMHLGALCCSIYNTSPPEQIRHVLTNADPKVLVTERRFLPALLAAREQAGLAIPVIVVDGREAADDILVPEEVEALGRPDFDFEKSWRALGPDDLLCLIYTSGTTGPPKGVELTHNNMLSKIRGWAQVYPLTPGGRSISFLPHAHVADRWMNLYTAMTWGHTIYWLEDANRLFECSAQVHPTVWGGVPRIWEKAKAFIEARFPDRDARIAQAAQIKQLLGVDQAEVFGTGAAPCPPHVSEFFAELGIQISDMWGLSESCGNIAVTPKGAPRSGTVGRTLPGVEANLADDGEILLRGATIMRGYRRDPEATAATFDHEGWLRTGDLARIDADGYITIVGRKKELIINAAGKNMSPHNIESAIKAELTEIEHVVAIGDRRPYNVALVVLEAGRSGDAARERVAAAVARANQHLSRVEQIKRFEILAEVWEPGGPVLTNTSKLKRNAIVSAYTEQIDALYA